MSLLRCVSAALASLLLSSVAAATPALPAPDANGDYGSSARAWYLWQVVDSDPAGLNCRATPEFESGNWLEGTYAGTLRNDIQNFPVVKRLRQGTVILVNSTPAGFALWSDDANKAWVRVSLAGDSDAMCFVRANKRFVKPVLSSRD